MTLCKKKKISSTISVVLDAQEVIDTCITLVTKNGQPLSLLEDKGFQIIVDAILVGLGVSQVISS